MLKLDILRKNYQNSPYEAIADLMRGGDTKAIFPHLTN